MALTDPKPGEKHKKISMDYIKCLSNVSVVFFILLHHLDLKKLTFKDNAVCSLVIT